MVTHLDFILKVIEELGKKWKKNGFHTVEVSYLISYAWIRVLSVELKKIKITCIHSW